MQKKEDDPVSQDEILSEHSFLCRLFFPISYTRIRMHGSLCAPTSRISHPVQPVSSPACI